MDNFLYLGKFFFFMNFLYFLGEIKSFSFNTNLLETNLLNLIFVFVILIFYGVPINEFSLNLYFIYFI